MIEEIGSTGPGYITNPDVGRKVAIGTVFHDPRQYGFTVPELMVPNKSTIQTAYSTPGDPYYAFQMYENYVEKPLYSTVAPPYLPLQVPAGSSSTVQQSQYQAMYPAASQYSQRSGEAEAARALPIYSPGAQNIAEVRNSNRVLKSSQDYAPKLPWVPGPPPGAGNTGTSSLQPRVLQRIEPRKEHVQYGKGQAQTASQIVYINQTKSQNPTNILQGQGKQHCYVVQDTGRGLLYYGQSLQDSVQGGKVMAQGNQYTGSGNQYGIQGHQYSVPLSEYIGKGNQYTEKVDQHIDKVEQYVEQMDKHNEKNSCVEHQSTVQGAQYCEPEYRVQGNQYAGVGSKYPGAVSQYPGAVSQYSGAVSQYPGAVSQYPGVGSQYPGVGSQYPDKGIQPSKQGTQSTRYTGQCSLPTSTGTNGGQGYQYGRQTNMSTRALTCVQTTKNTVGGATKIYQNYSAADTTQNKQRWTFIYIYVLDGIQWYIFYPIRKTW